MTQRHVGSAKTVPACFSVSVDIPIGISPCIVLVGLSGRASARRAIRNAGQGRQTVQDLNGG